MKLKKVLACSLAVVMGLSLASCACKTDDDTSEETKGLYVQPVGEDNSKASGKFKLEIDADTSSLDETSSISNTLYGLFLEDINFAADGGLYAEKVKNRSFEYGALATNGGMHGWTALKGSETTTSMVVIDGSTDKSYLNSNNTHYARLTNNGTSKSGYGNSGFLDGIALEKDAEYTFSVYLKSASYSGKATAVLANQDGSNVYAEAEIGTVTNGWYKYTVTLKSNATVNAGVRMFVMIDKGTVDMDMVSLFPKDTYNNHENGLRADLVEYLKELNPSFLRFPGGCVIEGKSLETMYSWKDSIGNGMNFTINGENTVGDVATRPLGIDLWADLNKASANPYYMSYGLGFFEYFELCEDLECLGVPILNAGMSCPIQSPDYTVLSTDSAEFKQLVQDALDLVEFCRGDKNTKWGAVRIAMGHEEPFELKYIGIGNEQWQSEYFVHYAIFKQAFDDAAKANPSMYGDIELIIANGPNSGDKSGWNEISSKGSDHAGLVDEHYYNEPSWFTANVVRYDKYDRSSTPVFLGEYAAKDNDLEAALAEAAFMTGVERNADIVKMACYAPLFGNASVTQWAPDMIWFKNNSVFGSVNYYVQKMFASNVGTQILNTKFTGSTVNENSIDVVEVKSGQLYQTTSIDSNGDIIVKLVNITGTKTNLQVIISNSKDIESKASVQTLSSATNTVKNSFSNPELVKTEESTIEVSEDFNYEVPAYSLSIIRIQQK